MSLWTAHEARQATGGTLTGPDWQASGVTIDSRKVTPGDLFIAIRGENTDGHRYVAQALAQGAAAALVSARPNDVSAEAPLLMVSDTTQALEALGRYARSRFTGTLIGMTGSVGKTSTKELLAQAFRQFGKTHATQGNLNNHFGLPLTLARMPQDSAYAIIEMGMNHAGEIAALTRQARPHIAIISAVAAVHLEFFENVEAIAHAKAEIFEGLEPGGVAILPKDNPYLPILEADALKAGVHHFQHFGKHATAGITLTAYRAEGDHTTVTAEVEGESVTYALPQPGEHFAVNSLAVLAAIHAAGLDIHAAAASLLHTPMSEGRGNRLQLTDGTRRFTLINDAYNASPISMQAALTAFNQRIHSRKCVILGDMRELGSTAPELHRALAAHPALPQAATVVTVGPLMQHLHDALAHPGRIHLASPEEAADWLISHIQDGESVLIKGSHGSGLYRLPELLGKHFRAVSPAVSTG